MRLSKVIRLATFGYPSLTKGKIWVPPLYAFTPPHIIVFEWSQHEPYSLIIFGSLAHFVMNILLPLYQECLEDHTKHSKDLAVFNRRVPAILRHYNYWDLPPAWNVFYFFSITQYFLSHTFWSFFQKYLSFAWSIITADTADTSKIDQCRRTIPNILPFEWIQNYPCLCWINTTIEKLSRNKGYT